MQAFMKTALDLLMTWNCKVFCFCNIDIIRVFSNCILYNGAESEIGLLAQALEKEFDRLSHDNQLEKYLNDDGEGEGEGEGEEDAEGRSEMRDESRTEDHRDDDRHEHGSQSHMEGGKKFYLLWIKG